MVDADYLVQPNWLSALVGHFDDPQVAVARIEAVARCTRGLYRQPRDRRQGDDRLFPAAHDVAADPEQGSHLRLVICVIGSFLVIY